MLYINLLIEGLKHIKWDILIDYKIVYLIKDLQLQIYKVMEIINVVLIRSLIPKKIFKICNACGTINLHKINHF